MISYFNSNILSKNIGLRLFDILRDSGYWNLLSNIKIIRYPQSPVEYIIDKLPPTLKAECELFILGRRVNSDSLPKELIEILDCLVDAGICFCDQGFYSTNGLALYSLNGLMYFAEIPSSKVTLYYGEDSWSLVSRLQIPHSKTLQILDFCSGPGIQSMICARFGCNVTSVEINPIATALEECNLKLNGLDNNVQIVNCSVEEFDSNDSSFDQIVANPPLVPIPDCFSYPFPGAGGYDGLRVTKQVLKKGLPMLKDQGKLITIGMSGGDYSGPFILDTVDIYNEFYDTEIYILNHLTLSTSCMWIQALAKSMDNQVDNESLSNIIFDEYRKAGITDLYTYALSITRRNKRYRKTQVFDFSDYPYSDNGWWIG